MKSAPSFGAVVLLATAFGVAACVDSEPLRADENGLTVLRALEDSFTSVIARAERSVVSIARIRTSRRAQAPSLFDPFQPGFGGPPFGPDVDDPQSPDYIPQDFGSGVIIAPADAAQERLILTAYHVVKGGPAVGEKENSPKETQIYVRVAGRHGCYARIRAADPRSDLAVLELNFTQLGLTAADLSPLPLTQTLKLRKGQIVLTLGNPYAVARDGSASASWGMISNLGRKPAPPGPPGELETIRKQTLHHFGTLLHIDSRLDLGTSGGAVVNLDGELIGLTTALAALEGYEKSVGFAIPIDQATRRVIDSLTKGHEAEYGFLGISPDDVPPRQMRRFARRLGQPLAALVRVVHAGSPAAVAGLLPQDIVLKVNERKVYGQYGLMRGIGELGPEAEATLTVWRPRTDQELHLRAKLGKWPVYNHEEIIATRPRYPMWRGIGVDYSTARLEYAQVPFRFHQAVLVTRMEGPTGLPEGRLKEGDLITHVNQAPVRTPAEFEKVARGLTGDATLQVIGKGLVVLQK